MCTVSSEMLSKQISSAIEKKKKKKIPRWWNYFCTDVFLKHLHISWNPTFACQPERNHLCCSTVIPQITSAPTLSSGHFFTFLSCYFLYCYSLFFQFKNILTVDLDIFFFEISNWMMSSQWRVIVPVDTDDFDVINLKQVRLDSRQQLRNVKPWKPWNQKKKEEEAGCVRTIDDHTVSPWRNGGCFPNVVRWVPESL